MSDDQDPNVARQLALEEEMIQGGTANVKRGHAAALSSGNESRTIYGQRLIGASSGRLTEAIKEWLKAYESGGSVVGVGMPKGQHGCKRAHKRLSQIDPQVAAWLTAKVIIDRISSNDNPTLANQAMSVGRSLEVESRLRAFRAHSPHFYRYAQKRLNKNAGERHKVASLTNYAKHAMGSEAITWPDRDRMAVGVVLVGLYAESTGLCEVYQYAGEHRRMKKHKPTWKVRPTPATLEAIAKFKGIAEESSTYWLPMVIPPVDWKGLVGGGYLLDRVFRLTLVKCRSKAQRAALDDALPQMSTVIDAVNAMQRTGYRVNQPVLEAASQMWLKRQHYSMFAGMPKELPEKPHDIETSEDAKRLWKKMAHEIYDYNNTQVSKAIRQGRTLKLAQRFQEDTLYYPHQLDWRGRAYPVPQLLTPQGDDLGKALLVFAEGKPIDTDSARDWLAIHGANCWGYDKAALADRVAWALQNTQNALRTAADPIEFDWWQDADDPWQFLAWCYEWAGYTRDPAGFVSHLPIGMDGSCNGLQHFSALLRDPVGGSAVNLIPSETPSDIYQEVADVTTETLRRAGTDQAARWLAFGVTRGDTKRSVMTLPYGSTQHSCIQFVQDSIKARVEKGEESLWATEKELFTDCLYLGRIVWASIGQVVVGAQGAMAWLQECAGRLIAERRAITWTAPSGFPVCQDYRKLDKKCQVITYLHGKGIVYPNLQFFTKEPHPRKHTQGVSPNFIHSYDAAALVYSVTAGYSMGIRSFEMVHDSYGVLAADAHVMALSLREAFVMMYQERDHLRDLWEEWSALLPEPLPPPPDLGELDITLVRDSDYFFA